MKIAAVVLAAGLGTRMKSAIPKVLHNILGRPMIAYVINVISKINPEKIVTVINPRHKEISGIVSSLGSDIALQRQPLGTADAVKVALQKLKGFTGTVLVINGDTPLVRTPTLKKFVSKHVRSRADVSVLSFMTDSPFSYGRVFRDPSGNVLKIVEEKDLTREQKNINEVNSGIYAVSSRAMGLIRRVKKNPVKGEYYLTDIIEMACSGGLKATVISNGQEEEFYGVNTMEDLLDVQWIMLERNINSFMKKGVRFLDPDSVIIHDDVRLGSDTVIYPNVYLEGKTIIGKGTQIYPGTRIVDSKIGKNVSVLDNSIIEESTIGDGCTVGPFARCRPESVLGKGVKIGNFVEIKNSRISDGTKTNHLSYIGDATIGKKVNIGAGTITCNYDGVKKHRTVIEDEVFIGSDTQLIAPVRIGRGAYVAAGSTITEDVQARSLAISRVRQAEHKDWAQRKKGVKK